MRKIVIRIVACFVALILVSVAWLAFQWLPPRPKLVVSRETTWITEPLLPDGTVDYEGAWKKERSVGLMPENNAAPYLFAAVGVDPSRFTEDERAALPKDVIRFAAFDEWYYDHEASLPEPLRHQSVNHGVVVDAVESGEVDSPAARLAAPWLDSISPSLEEIRLFVKRDHMVVSGQFHDAGWGWQLFEVFPAFRASAARLAGKGDDGGAFAHLASALRLARLQRSLGIPVHLFAAEAGEALIWAGALRCGRRKGRVSEAEIRNLLDAADPSSAGSRLRALITAERMQLLDFLVHPVPMSLVPNAEPSIIDRLVARIDPNRACRRFNEWADRVESASASGSWAERFDRLDDLKRELRDNKASLGQGTKSLWILRSRAALGDVLVDCVIEVRPSVLEMILPEILQSERALIELAALAYATETGHDPKSSDDLTPLLFEKPWRDRVTGAAVTFERAADGTLVARGPLIELQSRFEEWRKKPVSQRAH